MNYIKKKINYSGFSVALSISIVFTMLFFKYRNLFSNEDYLYIDHGFFLSYSKYFGEYILNNYFSTYGPLHYLYSGAPFPPLYPVGQLYFVHFISILGFSYSTSYKIFLFLALLFVGTSPYIMAKKLKLNDLSAVFCVLWFWIGMESFFLTRFSTGSIQHHIGSTFSMFFIINVYQLEFINNKNVRDNNNLISNSLLLFFSVFFNYMNGVFLALLFFFKILIEISKEKKISQYMKKYIKYLIKICLIAISLFSFWLIPNLFIHLPNGKYPLDNFLYTKEYSEFFNTQYLLKNIIDIMMIAIILFILIKFNNRNNKIKKLKIIRDLFIISLLTVFILQYTNNVLFIGLNSYRYLTFLEFSMVLIIGFFIHFLTTTLFSQKFKKKKKSSFNYYSKSLLLIMFTLFCFTLIDITHNNITNSTFKNPLKEQAGQAQSWNDEELEIMSWIKNNTNKTSRILFETSGDLTGFQLSLGHNMLNFAIETDRYYATGFTHPFFYEYHTQSNYMDGYLFGKRIEEINFIEFNQYFEQYNIEYVICWTFESKKQLQQFSDDNQNFISIKNSTKYNIYKMDNRKPSYILFERLDTITNFTYEQYNISFSISLHEPINNNEIILSLHDYPNWKIYINGVNVNKQVNNLGLMKFDLPIDYNNSINIQVIWEKSVCEKVGDSITIITFFSICLVDLGFFRSTDKYFRKREE